MKKQSRNSSMQNNSKYKIPKLKYLNQSSIATFSPSNSFFSNQPFFSISTVFASRQVPKVQIRPVQIFSKGKSGERVPEDIEFFEEFRKTEIKRSRKIFDEKFPFWFINCFDNIGLSSAKIEFNVENIPDLDENSRERFLAWNESLNEKINGE